MKLPILVVEENDGLREAISDALGVAGFDSLAAATPEIALEILRSHRRLGAVIADPVFAGAEPEVILRQLAAAARERGVPFLLSSAERGLGALALECGASACLPKPFELEALLFLAQTLSRQA